MKTAEAKFNFPVLGFTPDREIWGFRDLDTLTSCGSLTLKKDMQVGLELVDADGRRWIVRSVRRAGRARPLLAWLVVSALAGPTWRIEQELEELESVSLGEARERARVAIETFSDDYCAEDEREEILEPLLAQVKSAESIAQIYDLLQPDTFEGY